MGGQSSDRVARLHNTTPAAQDLHFDGSSLVWMRSGASPEVWRTTFELSINGRDWTMLGSGTRTSGGWKLGGVALSVNSRVRARGYVVGGYNNGSGWVVESSWNVPPSILTADGAFGITSNAFGFRAQGASNQSVVVEASSDLIEWRPLLTNTANHGLLYFNDTNWTIMPQRFYRARFLAR